ncbi:hypothetical protein J1N35_005187 [Gossypium stocksii]|uniref:RNase H type-1 domain-containing protein n=1 Tax=Gossypium stocksii TaxID=47602 RepID=A0A9D4AGS6_9ROSI|nr:hypothetical protein J1N35_005187 [Gossypium stocksii]
MKESFEGEVQCIWESSRSIVEKLDKMLTGLVKWGKLVRAKRKGLRKGLFRRLEGIEVSIDSKANNSLMVRYTEEEVFSTLKEIGVTKVLREDDFSALFFQRYWHTVGNDVTKFHLGILNEGKELDLVNGMEIVLIPKIQNLREMANFIPISLCTVLYKIVAKVIANRLQGIIRMCIDSVQFAFVPDKLIFNHVLIAYRILHTCRQKCTEKKGFMALKLDMSKSMIALSEDFWKAKANREGPQISHLLFVDDNIIFGKASTKVVYLGYWGCSFNQKCIICCALWAIWGDKNTWVHEKRRKSGKDLNAFVRYFINELEGVKIQTYQSANLGGKWGKPSGNTVKINFKGAYDDGIFRSASGIVARNVEGAALCSRSEVHDEVQSAFAAEAIACQKAVEMGSEMGWEDIIVEGDSLSIVKKCKAKNPGQIGYRSIYPQH